MTLEKPNNQFNTRLLFLAVIGFLFSAYLIYHHVSIITGIQEGPSFCSISSSLDCDKVAKSNFSEILGIPVASFAAVFYLLLAFLVKFNLPGREKELKRAVFSLCFLALLFTIYLALVSVLFIQTLCLFCSALYLLNPLIFYNALLLLKSDLQEEGKINLVSELFEGITQVFVLPVKFFSERPLHSAGLFVAVALSIFAPIKLEAHFAQRNEGGNFQAQLLFKAWLEAPKLNINTTSGESAENKIFSLGPVDAPITIVEFSDFECPFCQKTAPILKKALETYPDKVRLVFKNFPLDPSCNKLIKRNIHQFACKAARAVRCAGMQSNELFWFVHDELFNYPSLDEGIFEDLITIVGTKGSESAFSECLNSDTSVGVEVEIEEAKELEIRGTPSIYLNGRKIPRFSNEVVGLILKSLDATAG